MQAGQTVWFYINEPGEAVVTIDGSSTSTIEGEIRILPGRDLRSRPVFHFNNEKGLVFKGEASNLSTPISGLKVLLETGSKGSIVFDNSSISSVSGSKLDLNIDTGKFEMKNHAEIAFGNSPSSRLSIKAMESALLTDNSNISISSSVSDAGNISVKTQKLSLDKNSSIKAIEGGRSSDKGGDIELFVNELELRGGSSISVSSVSGSGSFNPAGGNIVINGYQQKNAEYVLIDNSSKIFARAQSGTGGNISINTKQFFGLKSNIDASSLEGSDGIVTISTLENDAIPSTQVLPTDFKNDLDLNSRPCQQHVNKSASQFLVSGRSGSPPSPDGMLMTKASDVRIRNGALVRVARVVKHDAGFDKKEALGFDCSKS